MKLNPKSDYLKGHVKADEIEFKPAGIDEGESPAKETDRMIAPPSSPRNVRRAKKKVIADKPVRRSTSQPAGPPIGEPADRPADQPTGRSISQSTDLPAMLSTITSTDRKADRPAAFYITERQSEVLDALVTHFKAAHGIKTDRSALLRAILGEPVLNLYDEGTHEELIRRLIDQLTNQLTSRQVSRHTDRQADNDHAKP